MNCRSWSRSLLGAALLLAAAASAHAFDRAELDSAVAARLDAAVADLQAWVRIPSITAAGDPHRADKTALLNAVVARAQALGLAARLLSGQQVAVVELGQGPDALGILVHADVVPAGDAARWAHPPFGGELVDGAVWGRGSLDDKGPLAASLYAMAALKDSGLPLTRPVRLIVGSSEENMDWRDLDAVRAAGLVPAEGWTADAGFPVIYAEKSYLDVAVRFDGAADPVLRQFSGGTAPNAVPEAATASLAGEPPKLAAALKAAIGAYQGGATPASFALRETATGVEITTRGKAAHGAKPEAGINAVTHLARLLHGARQALGIDTASAQGRAVAFIAEQLGLETDGGTLGLRHSVANLGASTVNLGLLSGSDEGLRAQLNIRVPTGLDLATQRARLTQALAPYQARLEVIEGKEALWVDPQTPLVQTLLGIYRQFTGDQTAPMAIGGTTYAKAFPGFVAFGMGFPGGPMLAHAENERLEVDHLRRGMAIYLAALAQLAAGVTLQPPPSP
ncbi:MAG: Sapep family Mn(2+)-dependent dipeptidase [Immundisolibacter sp.]|uniref:Sapep family Mn(2+)-dependent dipeptidase n=1 Tax=Immundisolibacter sp. TaxID=1934948 RepID=UPI0019C2DABF|nr:Sapep family Mn(2+)-dependent dipeptidase [Immundisolibacter sp.]MBC7160755.1 Sapep family Mn(2+)-dependent dipeptidase [Immundisolibacter sp.]